MKDTIPQRDLIWIGALVLCVFLICVTVLYVNANLATATVRFEMDDNTLEAVKAVNWSALRESDAEVPPKIWVLENPPKWFACNESIAGYNESTCAGGRG